MQSRCTLILLTGFLTDKSLSVFEVFHISGLNLPVPWHVSTATSAVFLRKVTWCCHDLSCQLIYRGLVILPEVVGRLHPLLSNSFWRTASQVWDSMYAPLIPVYCPLGLLQWYLLFSCRMTPRAFDRRQQQIPPLDQGGIRHPEVGPEDSKLGWGRHTCCLSTTISLRNFILNQMVDDPTVWQCHPCSYTASIAKNVLLNLLFWDILGLHYSCGLTWLCQT